MSGRIWGGVISLPIAFVAEGYNIYAFIILYGLIAIAGVLCLFLKENLKRSNYRES